MPSSYRVRVYRRNIASQFQRGGQGYRWLDRVRLSMHRAAENAAPRRSGELKGSHRSYIRGLNQYAAHAEVTNTSPHAEFVHEGTKMVAPIFPRHAQTLILSPWGAYGWKRPLAVRGQKPNPWLDEACSRIAMSRGAVPAG